MLLKKLPWSKGYGRQSFQQVKIYERYLWGSLLIMLQLAFLKINFFTWIYEKVSPHVRLAASINTLVKTSSSSQS